MLLWVLPVVAIGIGGWVIYARSRRRVRVVPEAFPEQSVQEGKRAGYIVYLPGIVVALIVGWRQLLPDWQLSAGENLAAGHGTGSGVAGQGAGSENRSAQRRRDVASCAGDAYSTAKKSGRYRRLDYVGRVGMALGNASIATDAYATAYRLDPKNSDAALGYAEALTRSSDPNDNRLGGELLRQLVRSDHSNIRVLSMYAFNALSSSDLAKPLPRGR